MINEDGSIMHDETNFTNFICTKSIIRSDVKLCYDYVQAIWEN